MSCGAAPCCRRITDSDKRQPRLPMFSKPRLFLKVPPAMSDSGVPFGPLFIGFQIDSISLLWSPEFIGTVYHEWKVQMSRKFFFVSMIVFCTLLGVSVGPSLANLVKPRLDYWPAGGTSFWIVTTHDVLYPKLISDSPSLAHCDIDTLSFVSSSL